MAKMHSEEFEKNLKGLEEKLYVDFRTLFDLNVSFFRRLGDIIDQKMNTVELKTDLHWSINFLFYRSYRLYWTTLILCGKGFGPEASILLRSLMEATVNMRWITEQNPEKRAALYRGYADVARKRLYDKYDKHGIFRKLTDAETESIESRQEIEKLYEEVKDDYREERFWAPKNIRSRAQEVGADYDWEFYYWYFSFFVHSSAVCQFEHLRLAGTEAAFIIGPSRSMVQDVLQLSYKYMLMALNVWNAVFELGLDDLLLELVDRLKEVSRVREDDQGESGE